MTVKIDTATGSRPGSKAARAALADLQAALRTLYGADAPAIVIYGSYARRQACPMSDLDVLLLYPRPVQRGQEIKRLSHTLADLNLRYNIVISVLPADQAEYQDQTSPFWMNVRREGVGLGAI